MPSCLFVALPVLLWSTHVLAASPVGNDVVEGTLRMEVGADGVGQRPIHIGPGVSTTLLFDTDIQQDQLSLESRAQFARVSTGSSVLVLVPSNDLQGGDSLKLSIPFKDAGSALPARLSLTLVVDSRAVDRQVEVYRRVRSAESYRQEVQQLRAEIERLRQERVSSGGSVREPMGLRGLLMASTSLPGIGVDGDLVISNCRRPCSFHVERGAVFTSGPRRAVQLLLRTSDKKPWTIGKAVLVNRQGKEWQSFPPFQSGPITAESQETLVLEFDVNNAELEGYQLRVTDVDGARTVQWSGINFP
ncbi:DUF2381 family protein [Corallococcus exiguus]|uniref:DUF2381 family protein n=1 Tax=Corallococcus exiguus TaxID=83462 RepID=A0A7X4YCP6_9BACT|nr:DUF2381 family protein [Corallococcus exiguus]NBC43026.1 DUF2381 family protein [Corallococcus exiguus]TNV63212.1 DUF2381 family protein [Corallococcus exiguus]